MVNRILFIVGVCFTTACALGSEELVETDLDLDSETVVEGSSVAESTCGGAGEACCAESTCEADHRCVQSEQVTVCSSTAGCHSVPSNASVCVPEEVVPCGAVGEPCCAPGAEAKSEGGTLYVILNITNCDDGARCNLSGGSGTGTCEAI